MYADTVHWFIYPLALHPLVILLVPDIHFSTGGQLFVFKFPHVRKSMEHLSFCVWLSVALNTMPSSSIDFASDRI